MTDQGSTGRTRGEQDGSTRPTYISPQRNRDAEPPAPDTTVLLDKVRSTVRLLLGELNHPPRALRVHAGDVTFDLEWEPPGSGEAPVHAAAPPEVPEPAGSDAPPDWRYVNAPTVGVFYHRPEPSAPPFVEEGSVVSAGQQVGIVEAMKLMIPIVSEHAGRVAAMLKQNGDSVEYDEPLVALTDLEAV